MENIIDKTSTKVQDLTLSSYNQKVVKFCLDLAKDNTVL